MHEGVFLRLLLISLDVFGVQEIVFLLFICSICERGVY